MAIKQMVCFVTLRVAFAVHFCPMYCLFVPTALHGRDSSLFEAAVVFLACHACDSPCELVSAVQLSIEWSTRKLLVFVRWPHSWELCS